MALVLLGIAAAGVLVPFGSAASVQAEGLHKTLAAKLANDLLERIISMPFEQIVGTWNGYTEPQGQVRDASDIVFADPIYAKFSRDVTCYYAYPWPQQGMVAPNFILVTVQVYYSGRSVVAIHRLISA